MRAFVLHMKNATSRPAARKAALLADPRRHAVAAEVRACIARAGKKRAEIEVALGISQSALARKLRGENAFTVDELLALGRALKVEPREFFPQERAA